MHDSTCETNPTHAALCIWASKVDVPTTPQLHTCLLVVHHGEVQLGLQCFTLCMVSNEVADGFDSAHMLAD